uniref:Uncharacterized protein n=1 Tax=Tetraodon nigroviridis TaxID=99883 RepID=H3DL49_TETNG
ELSHQGHPDDILPLLLTSVTQELFSCIADEHVTGESPYKLLKKDDIVQDMKKRAAVSDFSPAKQIVLEYPDEELLLVYDKTFTYGQCFYLVLTPEAKDRLLKVRLSFEMRIRKKEVLEEEEKVPSGPRQWIGLGSEREIEEESVKETRNKV